MSYIDCIKKSKISAQKKKEAEEIYKQKYKEQIEQGVTDADADLYAGQRTAEILETEKAVAKKRVAKTIQAQRKILENLDKYKDRKGNVNYGDAALAILDGNQLSDFPSITGRAKVIEGQIHSEMSEFLEKYSAKYAGTVRPKAGMRDIVKAMFGDTEVEGTAKELAEAVSKGLETLRVRANRAGANIGKKENFGMPQTHDRVKVAKSGRDASGNNKWVEFVMNRLDWDRMRDPKTGEPIPLSKRQAVLENVYDTIITEGYSKLRQGEVSRLSALDKRLANHRFLEFKDADAWLEYHEAFGVGSPFDVIVGHIGKMSRDVAVMEILGPNPNTGKDFLKLSVLQKAASVDVKKRGKVKGLMTKDVEKQLNKFDEMYSVYMNDNIGASESLTAATLAGSRNLMTSSFLGSASLLAVFGDFFTKKLTRMVNRMPASQDITMYAKLMNPLNKEDRLMAARTGMIAESWTSIAYGQKKFTGEIVGPEWTKRVADVVLRLSLLTPHTQASRWAFGMEFMGAMADYSGKSFEELPFKEVMKRYGITAQEWDIFRATQKMEERGVTFLRPSDLRVREDLDQEYSQQLADKFMEMINTEMEFAIPTGSLRSRTFLVSDSKQGTLVGELARSGAMFKNFPVTILFTHGNRALLQKTTRGKIAYAAAFGLGMTAMGALGLQSRQISQGKDPINMNPATKEGRSFWGSAALTGGGLGIWGDFLFSNTNRYGKGIENTLAGPVAGLATDTINLTVGNLMDLAKQEDTDFAAETVKYLSTYAPGKSLWYLRLVLEREVFDQAMLAVDPKAASKFRRMRRKQLREKKQDYFWPKGKSLLRGDNIDSPDFSNVFKD